MTYRKKAHRKLKYTILIIIGCLIASYLIFVFSPIPFVRKWRDIYIETAMTTNSHKWLATMFIPHSIIDEVMSRRDAEEAEQEKLESNWDNTTSDSSDDTPDDTEKNAFFKKYKNLN